MQLVLMNMSARFKNKEPTFGCRKHLSHRKKKKLSHYLKIAPLMYHEQRTVSLKRLNSFYFSSTLFSVGL